MGAITLVASAAIATVAGGASAAPPSTAIKSADCGPGSRPETGLQGQVPLADRESGRNQEGYSCNLKLLGEYQGEGSSWVSPSYRDCAYMSTSFSGIPTKRSQGVQVVDVADPAEPALATNLTSPAMFLGPWESLKVNEQRGLLAAVGAGPAEGALTFDVYDVAQDCTKPRLLNGVAGTNLTLPANATAHEGEWSPDGKTYWAAGFGGGGLTAIDVEDPAHPRIVYTGTVGLANHGFQLSPDGNRLYLARAVPAGLTVLDVSDVQSRKPLPQIRQVANLNWGGPVGISQHTIPVTYGGKPYLVMVDEFASEGVRIIDISDERNPVVVRQMQLEIQQPQNVDQRRADTTGNGLFGYDAHYCSVNRNDDPTALACGYFQSGVRVFDISDFMDPHEIAYFNPPARVGENATLRGSEHATGLVSSQILPVSDINNGNLGGLFGQGVTTNLSADWCSSPPRFVGKDQLWVTCQDNGFMALEFTNGAYKGA